MELLQIKTIEKESIESLSFKGEINFKQHKDLMQQLNQAMRLGNGYHTKVSIYFHDSEGTKRVETTIWAVGNKYVLLKGGIWIPIDRIQEVKF